MAGYPTRSRRDVLRTIGVTGAALAGTGSTTAAKQDDSGAAATTIKLVHDTHVHGRLGDADEAENVERYFGLMDELTADAEHAMRLGAGDDLGSSALSTEFEGKQAVEAFDAGGLSHDTFGNHDFDFGPDVLRERIGETAEFQWVSANTVNADTGEVFGADAGAKLYDVVEMCDVSVGVTGLLTPRATEVTSLGPDTEVRPLAEALRDVVPEMRSAGADVVVVLTHVANDVTVDLAAEVDGIDVMVGDDAAEVLGAEEVDGTVCSFVGDGYDHVGEIALTVGDDGVEGYDYALHETATAVSDRSVEPNTAVREVAQSYRNQIDREVIGRATVPLNCRTEALRTGETNAGNFVADAIREDVDADVVVQNGGGIRTGKEYPAGEMTDLLVRQILPFGNTTVKLEVTGETLLAALENGVSEVDTLEGRFPQVSGMQFTWNPDAPAGDRVRSVTVGGDPLDPEATYALATNNFVADGGDGYEVLTDAETLATGRDLATAVIDRIRRLTPVSPEVEGRITSVHEDTVAVDDVAVPTGATREAGVSLLSASNGLAGGSLTLSVGDPAVAEIVDATYADAFELADAPVVSDDGSSVELRLVDVEDAARPGDSDVPVATVSVEGVGFGTTDLVVESVALDDDDGEGLAAATRSGRVVTGPSRADDASSFPTDPDGDGLYEDLNGNGQVDYDDVVTFFENLEDERVTGASSAYDFNENGGVDYQDVVALYEKT